MGHELEIGANGAKMFYVGDTPWHGLGKSVSKLQTAEGAIQEAELDWTVAKQPVFVLRDGKYVEVKDRYEIVRSSDQKTMGIVGPDYNILQNREAFEFFDNVVDSGEAKYETAGALFGGRRIWMTARLGEDIMIAGEDAHRLYLLLTTSHDGSRSLTAATTLVRAVCNNTVTAGISSAKSSWTMTHKSTLKGKLEDARTSLELAFKYVDAFEVEVQQLLSTELTNEKFKAIVEGILPDQKRQKEKNLTSIIERFNESPLIKDTSAAGNAWGGYNAITEWLDHGREVRSVEARMTNLVGGQGLQIRNKAKKQLLALGQ